MSEKREGSEDAYGPVLQGPHDKAKATLLESQSPAVEPHTRSPQRLLAMLSGPERSTFARRTLRLTGDR